MNLWSYERGLEGGLLPYKHHRATLRNMINQGRYTALSISRRRFGTVVPGQASNTQMASEISLESGSEEAVEAEEHRASHKTAATIPITPDASSLPPLCWHAR